MTAWLVKYNTNRYFRFLRTRTPSETRASSAQSVISPLYVRAHTVSLIASSLSLSHRINHTNGPTKRSFSVYSMSLTIQTRAASCVSMVSRSRSITLLTYIGSHSSFTSVLLTFIACNTFFSLFIKARLIFS